MDWSGQLCQSVVTAGRSQHMSYARSLRWGSFCMRVLVGDGAELPDEQRRRCGKLRSIRTSRWPSCWRVLRWWPSRSPNWSVPTKLSATALPYASPTVPIDVTTPAAQPPAARPRGVLGAAIGVHDGGFGSAATPQRHLERVDDELGAQVVRDRPADHTFGPRVEHDREIDPAVVGGVRGDVGDPEPIGPVAVNVRLMRSSLGTALGSSRAQPRSRRRR
jgi:hypothetical protein